MEQERKIRREIANSNERRRMQSINAGFQSLRALLPHNEGEKLSKAAILQQTTQYIYQVEQEKTRLLSHNSQLKRLLNQQNQDSDGSSSSESPLPKRKKSDPDGVHPADDVDAAAGLSPEELKVHVSELRLQLERERRCRLVLQAQAHAYEAQLYPDREREVPRQSQPLNYHAKTSIRREHVGKSESSEDDKPSNGVRCADSPASSLHGVHHQQQHHQHILHHGERSPGRVPAVSAAVVTRRLSQESVVLAPFRARSNSSVTSGAGGAKMEEDEDTDMVDEDTDDETETQQEQRTVGLLAHVSGRVASYQSSPASSSPQHQLVQLQQASPQPHSPHAAAQVVPRSVSPIQQQQNSIRVASYPISTSRQNLETIVEAIRHLEGDHLFDDPSPKDKLKQVVTALALEEAEVESHCHGSSVATVPMASALEHHHHLTGAFRHHHSHLGGATSPSSTNNITTTHTSHHHSHHQHHHRVIQSSAGQTQSRPGVIVSVHS